jgi:hypothetical protein
MAVTCQYDQLRYPVFLGDLKWQTLIEAGLQLPENLPKLGTIIGGEFQTGPATATVHDDYIVVTGKIYPQILFLAELPEKYSKRQRIEEFESGNSDAEEKSLPQEYGASWFGEAGISYEERIDIAGIQPGMNVLVEVKPIRGVFEKENASQISFKGTLQINVGSHSLSMADFVSNISVEATRKLNLAKERLSIEELLSPKKVTIPIHSNLLLPAHKPGVARILKVTTLPVNINQELKQNRLFVRGLIDVNLIYVGSDDEGNPTDIFTNEWDSQTGFGIPFETYLDLDEGDYGELLTLPRVATRNTFIDPRTPHELQCLMDLDLEVGISKIYQKELVVDAIPEEGEIIDCLKYPLNIEEYNGNESGEITLEQEIELPSSAEDIERILACMGTPVDVSVEAADGKALVEGVLHAQLVYISDGAADSSIQVIHFDNSNENRISIGGVIDFPTLQPGTLLRSDIRVESLRAEALDERRLKLVAVFKVIVTARVPRVVFVMQDCASVTPIDESMRPSMLFYIVQTDDTLWKIARRYQTTMETVIRANSIATPDNLVVGQKLLIPRKIV